MKPEVWQALPVNWRVCPLGKVMLMSLFSVPFDLALLNALEIVDGGCPVAQKQSLRSRWMLANPFRLDRPEAESPDIQ